MMALQDQFSHAMITGLAALRGDNGGFWPLVWVGFAYGIFHAAGPGHGKAIIAAYAFSREKALGRTVAMAGAAALLQGCVAIALVGGLTLLLHATAATLRQTASMIEMLSFAAMALYGTILLWQKTGPLAKSVHNGLIHDGLIHDGLSASHTHDDHNPSHHPPTHSDTHGHGHHHHEHDHHHEHGHHHHQTHDHDADCGHTHAPIVSDHAGWRDIVTAVVAAGIRPCSGSILMLVFAFSQGLVSAGLAAALAIAAGTGLTTSALATFSVLARSAAQTIANRTNSGRGELITRGLETLAAACVAALGLGLVLASLTGQAPISGY
jgi:nickel/cobalt exporter